MSSRDAGFLSPVACLFNLDSVARTTPRPATSKFLGIAADIDDADRVPARGGECQAADVFDPHLFVVADDHQAIINCAWAAVETPRTMHDNAPTRQRMDLICMTLPPTAPPRQGILSMFVVLAGSSASGEVEARHGNAVDRIRAQESDRLLARTFAPNC